ncbi:hypothetical protein Tco_0282867 [Tanacetum coccineum]
MVTNTLSMCGEGPINTPSQHGFAAVLAVLVTGASQSRQHGFHLTVNKLKKSLDVLADLPRIKRRSWSRLRLFNINIRGDVNRNCGISRDKLRQVSFEETRMVWEGLCIHPPGSMMSSQYNNLLCDFDRFD